MIEPVKEDWEKIITEICDAIKPKRSNANGMGKLAALMKRQVGYVQRWKNGQEPKHYEGKMLLAIHAEYVPRGTIENKPLNLQNMTNSI